MNQLDFHIRHEVTPERCWMTLSALSNSEPFDHITQATRQLTRLRQLELITGQSSQLELTESAQYLAEIGRQKPNLVFDLLHFLHYTRWTPIQPLLNSTFWTYQNYCHRLYEHRECVIDLPFKEQIANEMDTAIQTSAYFGRYVADRTRKGAVSISPNTLNGIQHWLVALTPPVIETNSFNLRYFCPPELLLLAVGHLYTLDDTAVGVEMLLTREKRLALGQLTLVDIQTLDRSLDWMLPLYPHLIQPGTRTGSYGRSIRLLQAPKLKDVLV
jgi:hypothetical protein